MGGAVRKLQRGMWQDSKLRLHGLNFEQFRGTVRRTAQQEALLRKMGDRRENLPPAGPRRWAAFWRVVWVGTFQPSKRAGMRLRTWINLAKASYL